MLEFSKECFFIGLAITFLSLKNSAVPTNRLFVKQKCFSCFLVELKGAENCDYNSAVLILFGISYNIQSSCSFSRQTIWNYASKQSAYKPSVATLFDCFYRFFKYFKVFWKFFRQLLVFIGILMLLWLLMLFFVYAQFTNDPDQNN